MRIATFNANSIRARMDVILGWMEEHRPDALCVQETKVADDAFPADPIRAAGYDVVFRGQKAYNGVAILSRTPAGEVWAGFDDGGQRDEPRLLAARFGRVTVVNTYVPQGRELSDPMYAYKIEWFDRLRAWFGRRFDPSRDDVVWAGDMNVAPTPEDVYDPEGHVDNVCYHEAAREAFGRARDWGFTDVVRKHRPEPKLYTFFDYRSPNAVARGIGWRLDHILATQSLASRSRDAWVDVKPRLGTRPSDHVFVAADFAD